MPDRARHPAMPGFPLLKMLPWLVLLAGLGTTYVEWRDDRNDAAELLQSEFEFRVGEIVGDISVVSTRTSRCCGGPPGCSTPRSR
jgi:hypothetical protein